jgi:ankyrin repeat protein
MSALMYAVEKKASPEMVKLLLENNVDVTATTQVLDFCIALAHFCRFIQSAVLAFILLYHVSRSLLCNKNCANSVHFVAQKGDNVFMIAAIAVASKETMQLLLDSGCDIDALDRHDKSVGDVCKAAGTFCNRLMITTHV